MCSPPAAPSPSHSERDTQTDVAEACLAILAGSCYHTIPADREPETEALLAGLGVRSGADVVKALALGATAVGVGRPYAWGLALGGEDGVVHVLRTILAEADLIMAVDGYPTRADLTRDSLRRLCSST